MTKYLILIVISIIAATKNTNGQILPPIQLDRPDQTECPFITPKGFIQVENGFTIENVNKSQKSYSYPSSLWKYGVSKNVELRLITELKTEKNEVNSISGISPITIGFKAKLLEEKGIIPKTSFIGHINTSKIGSKQFQSNSILPSFRFTMQHTLTQKITVAYNLGAEWNDENVDFIYTLTSGFSLTEKLGFYAELYGFVPNDISSNHRCDGGFTYLVNDNLIFDFSGGYGLTNNAPQNYISLGVSYRFNTEFTNNK